LNRASKLNQQEFKKKFDDLDINYKLLQDLAAKQKDEITQLKISEENLKALKDMHID
jgi:hypothetical protein